MMLKIEIIIKRGENITKINIVVILLKKLLRKLII